ncbi:MAG: MFS transporter [Steroidobacteraceae bacterium]
MQKKTVDVGAVIDSAKYFWVPFGITVMMILIMLSDGFDLFTMGYVGPHLIEDWGITRGDLGPVNTAGLIGMAVGSVAMGWFADRIGRKRAYVSCLILLFAGSMLCYYARNVGELALWRSITGLGLGGVTPLATTLISEWTSKRVRSAVVACVIVAIPLGGSMAGIVEQVIVHQYGWRSMFLVGAIVPLVLFVFLWFLMPESPKFMAQHPVYHKRLAKALNRLLGENRFDGTEDFVVTEEGKRSANWFATLWNQDFWKRTALIWFAFAANSFVLYIFTNYLSVLLRDAGQSAEIASMGLQRFTLGAAFGSIGGGFLISWFGSRWVGSGIAFLGALGTALIGTTAAVAGASPGQLLLYCLLAGASVNGMQAFMYAVAAHSYPTEIRGSAVGMAQTFSRLGGVLSPSAATFYFNMQPQPPVNSFFLFVAGVAVLTTISFFLIPTPIPGNYRK